MNAADSATPPTFWYFGYGSNMSTTALAAKGVEALSSKPATLHGYALVFDVPNFFAIEGGAGNVVRRDAAVTHGVLHECRSEELRHLDALEALGVVYDRVELAVRAYDDEWHDAVVYGGQADRRDAEGRPSRRYLSILVQGAEEQGLDAEYVDWLLKLQVHELHPLAAFVAPAAGTSFRRKDVERSASLTSLGGHVFDLSVARPEHEYLKRFFRGRDVTLFFLQRLDSNAADFSTNRPDSGVVDNGLDEAAARQLRELLRAWRA